MQHETSEDEKVNCTEDMLIWSFRKVGEQGKTSGSVTLDLSDNSLSGVSLDTQGGFNEENFIEEQWEALGAAWIFV